MVVLRLKLENLRSSWKASVRKCMKPSVMVALVIIIAFVTCAAGCSQNSVVYVDDSDHVVLLDVNEPAPFRGVLITEGRHERLLDYEDEILSQ